MEKTSFAAMHCCLARDLDMIGDWWSPLGDRWARPKEGSPVLFVHKACGHQFRPQVSCSECGEPIEADAVQASAGPSGAAKGGTVLIPRRLRGRSVTAP